MARPTYEQMSAVTQAIYETPIIDNHAHPLLKVDAVDSYSLLSLVSEAHGAASKDCATTLPQHRAVQQLSRALGCAATWEAVQAAIIARRSGDYTAWVAECLGGLETILLDDGLGNPNDTYAYTWHSKLTRSPCRRIVRIETLAAEIINRHCVAYTESHQPVTDVLAGIIVLDSTIAEFDAYIEQCLTNPNVAGFKSVICYRTGLDVPGAMDTEAAQEAFSDIVTGYSSSEHFSRLQHAGLNELFVHRLAQLVRDSRGVKKPIQFHTGLGDNDITLTRSSPAHLQAFIRAYPTVPIVLLHAGYPYVRDTAYLATVYDNVYADIGAVFPILARHGQEAVLRETFEMCPWSKVMWSTDGVWFPERYRLAVLQVREVLDTVICELVQEGDLSAQTAGELVQSVLFENANRVYNLGLELPRPATGAADDTKTLAVHGTGTTAIEQWKAFTSAGPAPDFVRICWLDYSAMPRMRMIPFKRFDRLVLQHQAVDIGITKVALGILPNDTIPDGLPPTGEYRLHPDFATLKRGPIDGHVSMYGNFHEQDGAQVSLCPRTQLIRALQLSAERGISYLVGFEIEFVLLQPVNYDPLIGIYDTLKNHGHMWSASRFYVDKKIPQLLHDIVDTLDRAGIQVEQLHAESAPGQFELILPAKPPLEAVDTLLLVRETIASQAADAGLQFTLHPKPLMKACGTASHMHLSLSTADGLGNDASVYEPFYASILAHLPALVALTYSNPASYERVRDGAWAGGRWVAWGTQNREMPLRKIEGSHWEIKCLDGLANPYLVLAALLSVGLRGIADQQTLTLRDCAADPATLTTDERHALGITTMLPASLKEALEALASDGTVAKVLDADVVERYMMVKRAEMRLYDGFHPEKFDDWIIGHY